MATKGKTAKLRSLHAGVNDKRENITEAFPDEPVSLLLETASEISQVELPYELKLASLGDNTVPGNAAQFIYGALHTVKNSAKLNAEAEISRCRDLLNVRTQDYRRMRRRTPILVEEARNGAFAQVLTLLEVEQDRLRMFPAFNDLDRSILQHRRSMLIFLANCVTAMVRGEFGNAYMAALNAEAIYGPEKYDPAEVQDTASEQKEQARDLLEVLRQEEYETLREGLRKATEDLLSQTEKDIIETALQEPFPGAETAQG